MTTVIDKLKEGKIPGFISKIANYEQISENLLIENILNGYAVIPKNNQHELKNPLAIGKNCQVKINANIGTSPKNCDFEIEFKKFLVAKDTGADTIMDLSIAGNSREFRKQLLNRGDIVLGTVPIYESLNNFNISHLNRLNINDFIQIMELQAQDGVDFMTIHAGLLQKHIPLLDNRTMGIVSRGGSILVKWMRHHQKENFLYEYFDKILAIASKYDVTLSLGDGLRPGATADANDAAQFGELEVIGELVKRCRDVNVQVMVEGPGHVPLNLIKENIQLEKKICSGAPFYVLGPLVIDYAPGYDHITAAIGGALAGMYGADFLCYVTPAEHLRLPTLDDVHKGVIASKIAAGAADLAHNHPSAIKRNLDISLARKRFDWATQREQAICKATFDQYLEKDIQDSDLEGDESPCSMCGEWCALKQKSK